MGRISDAMGRISPRCWPWQGRTREAARGRCGWAPRCASGPRAEGLSVPGAGGGLCLAPPRRLLGSRRLAALPRSFARRPSDSVGPRAVNAACGAVLVPHGGRRRRRRRRERGGRGAMPFRAGQAWPGRGRVRMHDTRAEHSRAPRAGHASTAADGAGRQPTHGQEELRRIHAGKTGSGARRRGACAPPRACA